MQQVVRERIESQNYGTLKSYLHTSSHILDEFVFGGNLSNLHRRFLLW